jgi:hypothetical protein
MQNSMNESEIQIFKALMSKEFDDKRIRFLKDYQILMLVREDDFYERHRLKIQSAISFLRLKDTDEALEKEIVFTSSN